VNENEIQKAVFKHLRQRPAPGVFAFHPKNGGVHQRGRSRGINAGLGVVSGVPDVIVIRAGAVYGLELKSEDAAKAKQKPSDEQLAVKEQLLAAGAFWACAVGLDEAIDTLEQWGLLRGVAA
jgi:hypothetical protein